MSRVRPPSAGDADEIIGDANGTRERLLRLFRALFSFYERGGPHIEVDIRERQVPGMREWEESQRATVRHWSVPPWSIRRRRRRACG